MEIKGIRLMSTLEKSGVYGMDKEDRTVEIDGNVIAVLMEGILYLDKARISMSKPEGAIIKE
jgi:hypothetical protein